MYCIVTLLHAGEWERWWETSVVVHGSPIAMEGRGQAKQR